MAYIYSDDKDGIIYSPTEALYNAARNATDGAAVTNHTSDQVGIDKTIAGRSVTYQYRRGFFFFDVEGEEGTAESCTLEIYTSSANSVRMVIVDSNAHEGLIVEDFDQVFSIGTTDMTRYAVAVEFNSTGYQTFNLNPDGLTDLNSAIGSGYFRIALVSRDDSSYNAPSADSLETVIFGNSAVNKPRIEITYSTGVTYNAPFLGANF